MDNTPAATFKQYPIGLGYTLWLAFIASLHGSRWQAQAQLHGNAPFSQWLDRHTQTPHGLWLHMPQVLGFVLGIVSMAGALTYSGTKPVNIWLMLGVFCALPLITMLWTVKHVLAGPHNRAQSWWVKYFNHSMIKHFGLSSPLPHTPTLAPWLMWRLQLGAASFHIAAMLTFSLILLFNDVAFGWSSTLISDPAAIHGFFNIISLPWQGLILSPSLALLEQTQFFYSQEASPSASSEHWWPHLLFALFFYGLAPRLALCAWLKHRAQRAFRLELDHNLHIQRFLRACHQVTSHNAKSAGALEANPHTSTPVLSGTSYAPTHSPTHAQTHDTEPNAVFTLPQNAHLLVWQRTLKLTGLSSKTLGTQSWQHDEQWLSQQDFNTASLKDSGMSTPIIIVVHAEQTPTAELSDLIALIKTPPQLLLLCGAAQASQLKSWQYFAREHHLTLQVASHIASGPTPPEPQL
ncbi:DUF2868 domain-containing protein [Marinagarivorans algicola]|uniref:DUF2868 domain-containing protein n=1 Tax=Marinagarivorans algicola TaxID=1513270 RepID=UPI0006B692D8|nr:DUF2868 domain-containing protein [Marinagarivorans algicola]